MKVLSSKKGSSRQRTDASAELLPVAHWRIVLSDTQAGKVRASGQRLVLTSRSREERDTELWLTEEEALVIAKTVSERLISEAMAAFRLAADAVNIQKPQDGQ